MLQASLRRSVAAVLAAEMLVIACEPFAGWVEARGAAIRHADLVGGPAPTALPAWAEHAATGIQMSGYLGFVALIVLAYSLLPTRKDGAMRRGTKRLLLAANVALLVAAWVFENIVGPYDRAVVVAIVALVGSYAIVLPCLYASEAAHLGRIALSRAWVASAALTPLAFLLAFALEWNVALALLVPVGVRWTAAAGTLVARKRPGALGPITAGDKRASTAW